MEYRSFGKTELKPSVIGFGCNRIAGMSTDRREVEATLQEALDRGINFFDTADSYNQGDSERLLGKVFRGQRDRLIICSKAGNTLGAARRFGESVIPLAKRIVRRWKPARAAAIAIGKGFSGQNFEPNYIKTSIESSLRRIRTDYLDLFLLHNPPIEVIAVGAIFEMLDTLKDSGMIRYYGVSCSSKVISEEAIAFLQHADISALQIPVNLLNINILEEVLPLAIERRIAIVARAPFGDGAVFSHTRLVDALAKIPGRTPAQTAIRFVIQLNTAGVVLPGMTIRDQLDENIGAVSAPPLSADEMKMLYSLARNELKN